MPVITRRHMGAITSCDLIQV